MKRASVLDSAVTAFCRELDRFARSAAADVDAVTAALAAAPGTAPAAAVTPSTAPPTRDAAAPFLDMLTRATEEAEDAVEAVGAVAGVTVPRAQQLVAAALGTHAQQAAALRELEGLLRELGVPLPPRRTRPAAPPEPDPVSASAPVPVPADPPPPSTAAAVPGDAQARVAPLEAYGISGATRRMIAAGAGAGAGAGTGRRSSAQISVDVRTGRVSVSHRRQPSLPAAGAGAEEDEDEDEGDAEAEEPTLLSVPAAVAAARTRQQRVVEEDKEAKKEEPPQQQPAEVTPLCAAGVPDGRNEEEEKAEETERQRGGPVAPFASMAELTRSVPSFLLSTTLEDLNASIAALNRAYVAQQQRGGPCRLTSDEAYAVLGDDRLCHNHPHHPHHTHTHALVLTVLSCPTALRCRAKLLVLQKAARIRMTIAGTTTVWVPQETP